MKHYQLPGAVAEFLDTYPKRNTPMGNTEMSNGKTKQGIWGYRLFNFGTGESAEAPERKRKPADPERSTAPTEPVTPQPPAPSPAPRAPETQAGPAPGVGDQAQVPGGGGAPAPAGS